MDSEAKPGKILPMSKIFDEILYARNYRNRNLLILIVTLFFIMILFIFFMTSLYGTLNFLFVNLWSIIPSNVMTYTLLILIIGIGVGILVVWMFRINDIRRGVTFALRHPKLIKILGFLFRKLKTVPPNYDPRFSTEENYSSQLKELLLWESDKRISRGVKALVYIIVIIIGLVFLIIFNFYSFYSPLLGLILTPTNFVILIFIFTVISLIPTSIRLYYCLSPVFFTCWILNRWMEGGSNDQSERKEPRNTFFQPLHINLTLLSTNYLNLDIGEIDEMVTHLYTYFIIKNRPITQEKIKEKMERESITSSQIDERIKRNLQGFRDFLKDYAIDYRNYSSKEFWDERGQTRQDFNNELDYTLEKNFFELLLIMDDIQEHNKLKIGNISIKFKIDWRQRLLNNFSNLTFSSVIATVITLMISLLPTILSAMGR